MIDLARSVVRFAKRLRSKHAIDRACAERLARLFRASLVPRRKPGRKPTDRVLTALKMRGEKLPWSDVYRAVIPGYAELHPCDRIHLSRNLRRAVAAFLKRRGG